MECAHIFPAIGMHWLSVINRPKQLLLVLLPCHNVLTHYVFSNTFGILGFPSESQYLTGWKQSLNTVRIIQICSNLKTQWIAQLSWDVHYTRRDTPFLFSFNFFIFLLFLAYCYYVCHSSPFLGHINKINNRKQES